MGSKGASMAYDPGNRWAVRGAIPQVDIDVGLRQYMLRVYNYMASGLALTGIVAYLAASTGIYASMVHSGVIWLVVFAPLGIVFAMGMGLQRMSAATLQLVYWAFSIVMGLSLGYVFLRYTG